MLTFIALFIPSAVGLKLIDYFDKGLDFKRNIYYYILLLLLSTIITNVLVYLFFGVANNITAYLDSLPIFFAKYALVSLVLNLLLGLIIVVIRENISFQIEVEKVEKERKKDSKDNKNNIEKIKRIFKKVSSK